MGNKTITVLDPTAKPNPKLISIVRRINKLDGKVVGFLWNEKPNGDVLLNRIKEMFAQKYNLSGTIWHKKETASRPASSVILNDLSNGADLVINAIADWGACSTWSVHDSVEIEKKGVPTVTICTDRFEGLSKLTAKNLGLPNIPLAVIKHPLGGLKEEAVEQKADNILEDLIMNICEKE